MASKLTKDGVVLPGNENVIQTKSILSVDGKEADERGNIDLGGAFDFVDKKTQIRGCKALTWNTLRVQGLDDWERKRDTEFVMDPGSLTISSLTGEYVYIAEVDFENKSSAYYRSDNGGATYSRHILPEGSVDVKLIRTSDTGEVVLLSTNIGGVLLSEDYGKTWIIPNSLNGSLSNSKSSWFISMSSNGKNLIYPNLSGNLYLDLENEFSRSRYTLVLPSGVFPNSIKELFVSNHTDRVNIKMVMVTINGDVWTSINGGNYWDYAISGVNGMYTDKDVEIIYVIKGSTVQFRHIGGDGFSPKVDFKTYSKYKDITEDPNSFYLSSIFVSKDYKTGEHKIAVFTVQDDLPKDNLTNKDLVEGEDVLHSPEYEKVFTGILISEDSGNTWDLSQIKYTRGVGGTPEFLTFPTSLGYSRLQLIENFESGILLYNNNDSVKVGLNNIIRICDKSTSYSSTSKMILDGGITLGQSMESDTEYYNKMPGTIEYENFKDGYIFHFDKCTWVFPENETGAGSTFSTSDSEILKPLTVTGVSDLYGKRVKNIEFSDTLTGMKRLNTVSLNSDNILMPPYTESTTSAKLLEISNGVVRPSSINSSNLGGDCFIYTENSIPKEGYIQTGSSSNVLLEKGSSNLRWFDFDDSILDETVRGISHLTEFIYDEKNSQIIKVGTGEFNITQGLNYSYWGVQADMFSTNNVYWHSDEIIFFEEDKNHSKTTNVDGKRYNFSSKEAIKLGLADFTRREIPSEAKFPIFNVTPKISKPGEYSPEDGQESKKTGAGIGKKMLIYNDNLYIFGGQLNYISDDEPADFFMEDYGFPFGKVDLITRKFSLLKHPGSISGDISTQGYTTNAEFTFPVAFFEYSGDLYVLIKVLQKNISDDPPPYHLYKYIISTDNWIGPKQIIPAGGLLLYDKTFPDQNSFELANDVYYRRFKSYDKAQYYYNVNSLVKVLNVNDDIYFIRTGNSWTNEFKNYYSQTVYDHDERIFIGMYPKKSLVNIFNTGTQDTEGAIEVLGELKRDKPQEPTSPYYNEYHYNHMSNPSSLVGTAVCYDGSDNIIIHGGFLDWATTRKGPPSNTWRNYPFVSVDHQEIIYKWSISRKTFSKNSPKLWEADSFQDFKLGQVNPWEDPYPYFNKQSPRRSFHTILPIQGHLIILGGYHNSSTYEPGNSYIIDSDTTVILEEGGSSKSNITGQVVLHNDVIGEYPIKVKTTQLRDDFLSGYDHMKKFFVDKSWPLYLTDDKGNTVTSEYKTLYLHKLEEESSNDCNYTSLLVNENVYNIDDHETRITSLKNNVSTLESRITSLERGEGKLIPLPQWSALLNTNICPRIQYSTGGDSDYYELNYDIFYKTLSSSPIPDRAILYVRVHTGASYNWGPSLFQMTGYDRVYYSTSSTLNPPLQNSEEYIVSTQGIANAQSYIDWSGYLFPTWGNPDGSDNPSPPYRGRIGLTPQHPRKLAIRWAGVLYMTVLGYMMPNYTD